MIGDMIAKVRKEKGMTKTELAKLTGINIGHLTHIEKGERNPSHKALKNICKALDVPYQQLMYTYDKLLGEYNHTVAQLLITGDDVANQTRHRNFRNTLNRLLELEAIPILNENDTVATDEIVIGDNDTLAAIVASSINARKLILLSDIDGLYTADPHTDPNARLLSFVSEITDEIRALGGGSAGNQGTGGMATKLRAAEICLEAGCDMVITNGKRPDDLYDILSGKPVGTTFSREVR